MLKDHDPVFGKSIIESLSEGMYDNPLFLYREYVQNSADAIDAAIDNGIIEKMEGQIEIVVDPAKRIVSFADNGTGIRSKDVPGILTAIGKSPKDRLKNKGFRGIGRLGGLGYCRIVRFETSYAGEQSKSILEWDAEKLHEILLDPKQKIDAGGLIKEITSIRMEKACADEHYFRVAMIDINTTSEDLLDVEDVRRYLSMVAPVPFDYQRFRYVSEIEGFIREHGLEQPNEYQVYLNGDEIRKGYSTPLTLDNGKTVDVLGVECRLLKEQERVVGWYWFCISRFEGVLPKSCWQRCIRLRKDNIQIGERDCLSNHPKRGQSLWKEDRGNNYFMGEIHVLDSNLIPNSRRDYFNQDEACRRFESVLATEFLDLNKIYHAASEIRSATHDIEKANAAVRSFKEKEKSNSFFDEAERERELKQISELSKKAEKSKVKLDNVDVKTLPTPAVKVYKAYGGNEEQEIEVVPIRPAPKKEDFVKSTLPRQTQSVLDKVFAVVDAVLPPDEANVLRTAIKTRFGLK